MSPTRLFSGCFILAAALAASTVARATDAVVGPGQCNEAGFSSALDIVDGSGGGTITFDCGSAPATILFTNHKTIAGAVTIDGEDRIIFDGGGTSPFFQVFASADVRLRRMTLHNGALANSRPLENIGTLLLDHVQVLNNVSGASAIDNVGSLTIVSSVLSGNAITGTLNDDGGALLNVGGDVVISKSRFVNNSINGGANGKGGAIALDGNGTLTVSDTLFQGNGAGVGGAISVQSGQLTIIDSEFVENSAASAGGAIHCTAGLIDVRSSAFADNLAGTDGAGIFSNCALSTLNLTIAGNTAGNGGGGIYQDSGSDASITFVTFNGNSASFGGGLYNEFNNNSVLRMANSIISENTGSNCDGAIVSSGYNLSSGDECVFSNSAPGDFFAESLPLQPYGLYGGPTSTQPPLPGNVAIDHVPIAACGPPGDRVDQRGAVRPVGSGCDSGAVEFGGVPDDAIFTDGFDSP